MRVYFTGQTGTGYSMQLHHDTPACNTAIQQYSNAVDGTHVNKNLSNFWLKSEVYSRSRVHSVMNVGVLHPCTLALYLFVVVQDHPWRRVFRVNHDLPAPPASESTLSVAPPPHQKAPFQLHTHGVVSKGSYTQVSFLQRCRHANHQLITPAH